MPMPFGRIGEGVWQGAAAGPLGGLAADCGLPPVAPWRPQDELHLPKESIPQGGRVVVVDDLLATGGTLASSCRLVATGALPVEGTPPPTPPAPQLTPRRSRGYPLPLRLSPPLPSSRSRGNRVPLHRACRHQRAGGRRRGATGGADDGGPLAGGRVRTGCRVAAGG